MAVKDEITRRWEEGVPHDPRSEAIVEAMAKLDFQEGGDFLCIKTGGDGDNGEHMMFLLDVLFERGFTLPAPTNTIE